MGNYWWWIKYLWPAVVYGILFIIVEYGDTLSFLYFLKRHLGSKLPPLVLMYISSMYCLFIGKSDKKYTKVLIGILGGFLLLQVVEAIFVIEINDFPRILGSSSLNIIGSLFIIFFYFKRYHSSTKFSLINFGKLLAISVLMVWNIVFHSIVIPFFYDQIISPLSDTWRSILYPFIDYVLMRERLFILNIKHVVFLLLFSLWFHEIMVRRKEALKAQSYSLIAEIGKTDS